MGIISEGEGIDGARKRWTKRQIGHTLEKENGIRQREGGKEEVKNGRDKGEEEEKRKEEEGRAGGRRREKEEGERRGERGKERERGGEREKGEEEERKAGKKKGGRDGIDLKRDTSFNHYKQEGKHGDKFHGGIMRGVPLSTSIFYLA